MPRVVTDAYGYFRSKFVKSAVDAFKAARYLSPTTLDATEPTTSDIDSLKAFEFPAYLAAAEDTSEVEGSCIMETMYSCQ